MEQAQLLAHCGTNKITRDELTLIPTPEGTQTYQPLAHRHIVDAVLLFVLGLFGAGLVAAGVSGEFKNLISSANELG
jgi:hypothetical protein